jgi:hypothetical protein
MIDGSLLLVKGVQASAAERITKSRNACTFAGGTCRER